jgi:hypothetical protein
MVEWPNRSWTILGLTFSLSRMVAELCLSRTLSSQHFHNRSRRDFQKFKGELDKVGQKGFSSKARDIIEHFGCEQHIEKLEKPDRLYLVVAKFVGVIEDRPEALPVSHVL